jgi:hypothetical protein
MSRSLFNVYQLDWIWNRVYHTVIADGGTVVERGGQSRKAADVSRVT